MDSEVKVGVGEEEEGLGRQAKWGLLGSPTMLAGYFPPPFRGLHWPPEGVRKGGGSAA